MPDCSTEVIVSGCSDYRAANYICCEHMEYCAYAGGNGAFDCYDANGNVRQDLHLRGGDPFSSCSSDSDCNASAWGAECCDGQCYWPENYTLDPASCEYTEEFAGCTDTTAINYDSVMVVDDGSCQYLTDVVPFGIGKYRILKDFPHSNAYGQYIYSSIDEFYKVTGMGTYEQFDDLATTVNDTNSNAYALISPDTTCFNTHAGEDCDAIEYCSTKSYPSTNLAGEEVSVSFCRPDYTDTPNEGAVPVLGVDLSNYLEHASFSPVRYFIGDGKFNVPESTEDLEIQNSYDYRPLANVYIGKTKESGYSVQKFYEPDSFENKIVSAPNQVSFWIDITSELDATEPEPEENWKPEFGLIDDNGENVGLLETGDFNTTPSTYFEYGFMVAVARWNDAEISEKELEEEMLSFKSLGQQQIQNNFFQNWSGGDYSFYEINRAKNQYIWKSVKKGNGEPNILTHTYNIPGIKTIRAFVFSFVRGTPTGNYSNVADEAGNYHINDGNDRITPIRWKSLKIKVNLSSAPEYQEDFSDIGSVFNTLPWPYPGKTPIISGLSDNSNYNNSLQKLLVKNPFSENEIDEKLKVYAAADNDETGDFLGQVDLEQTRVFKGAYDMDQLLMIVDMVGEELFVGNLYIAHDDGDDFDPLLIEELEPGTTRFTSSGGDFAAAGSDLSVNIDHTATYRIQYTINVIQADGPIAVGLTSASSGYPDYLYPLYYEGENLTITEDVRMTNYAEIDHSHLVMEFGTRAGHDGLTVGTWTISNVSVREVFVDVDDSTYNPYYDFEFWDGENNFYPLATGEAEPNLPESCVGMIFINDSSNTTLKNNCVLEFNFGDIYQDVVEDTSGYGNRGILIGDYSIQKNDKGEQMIRDSIMNLPKIDNTDRAI